VDTSATDAKAREFLRGRFETCYPFHPSTLTVFQRKWQALPQFQQTRGTLAMLAQWVSLAFREGYQKARREPLITLGSAPLDDRAFRSAMLGQLGESRLIGAIDSDIAGAHCHAAALDADATGPLRDIHRRVGTAVLFESSGGQTDKAAHLPDLRFALGEPEIDTTSIDNAVAGLVRKGYYIRKVGADGYRFGVNPTLNKVVSDRRASLDESEVNKACSTLVKKEFERGASVPVVAFPEDGATVPDTTRLTVVVLGPEHEMDAGGDTRKTLAAWTASKGSSPRLYPAALLWAVRRPGRALRDRVETWLAWKRVVADLQDGTIGHDFDRSERSEVATLLRDAEDAATDEVWADYRYVLFADRGEADGMKVIDLGAGHATATESLTSRVVAALKMEGLLNDSIGAGYLDRRWPPAFAEDGAWPLSSLRQAFLSGAMTRVLDIDGLLRAKIPEFVARGEFGLASGVSSGRYSRVWFLEEVDPAEVVFETDVLLLKRAKAKALKGQAGLALPENKEVDEPPTPPRTTPTGSGASPEVVARAVTLVLEGEVPTDVWNRIGTRLIPKLRSGQSLKANVRFEVSALGAQADSLQTEVKQALADLELTERLKVVRSSP
jgi:hypothetical protein